MPQWRYFRRREIFYQSRCLRWLRSMRRRMPQWSNLAGITIKLFSKHTLHTGALLYTKARHPCFIPPPAPLSENTPYYIWSAETHKSHPVPPSHSCHWFSSTQIHILRQIVRKLPENAFEMFWLCRQKRSHAKHLKISRCIYSKKYVWDILNYLRHIFDYLPCIFNLLREVFYHTKNKIFFRETVFSQTSPQPIFYIPVSADTTPTLKSLKNIYFSIRELFRNPLNKHTKILQSNLSGPYIKFYINISYLHFYYICTELPNR